MAEEKIQAPAEKTDKPKKEKKKDRPSVFSRIGGFLVDCKSELKKVVWLSKEDTVKQTAVAVVMMVASGAIVGILDFVLTKLILLIGGMA